MGIILIVSIITNVGLYFYWYDSEYPHGKTYASPTKIEIFYGGWYCDRLFIHIGDTYEIKDFDAEKELFSELHSYVNVRYNYSECVWCDNNIEKIITINDSRDIHWEIKFHTYDRLLAGNDVSYAKTKVIDDLRISGTSWSG